MGRSKEGVNEIAAKAYADADDDGSGELSVIEVFCILPDLDKSIKAKCRVLEFDEYESDTEDEMEPGDGGMFGWFKKLTGDSKIEELKKQFAHMDKDGGGTVDRDEIV